MVRIVDIKERPVAISRYEDRDIPSGGLTTSIVAVTTDFVRDGSPVVGFGFSSIGRFAQSGLIRERFAPRLLLAHAPALNDEDGANLDPMRAWKVMLATEKPGGHGERCVAVGTLDMALWDAASKIAGLPLHAFIRRTFGRATYDGANVAVYASGGYPYPYDDIARLVDETHRVLALGYTHMKIKIGASPLQAEVARIRAAASSLGSPNRLAVDAMNVYDAASAEEAAHTLGPLGLWWFEDVTDPLDFATWATVARAYPGCIAAGEALFSQSEAALLAKHGGLRPDRDILLFDPVHTYGLPGYLAIVASMAAQEWPHRAFWPHGGHLFSLHIASALGLGGCEMNPFSFQPFGGIADDMRVIDGTLVPPQGYGIGFERKEQLAALFATLDKTHSVSVPAEVRPKLK